jgi:hypothetical protein
MEITVNKTIQETHQIDLPAYRKNICYYYKIISEEQAVQVCFAKDSEAIAMSYTSIALIDKEVGTQEEFDLKFNEVITILMEKTSI